MPTLPFDQRFECEKIIAALVPRVHEWLRQKLSHFESYEILPGEYGIGFRVWIRSPRSKQLILSLHRDVIGANYTEPNLRERGRYLTAWFGFSEPGIPKAFSPY
jgi:hypothetical protein